MRLDKNPFRCIALWVIFAAILLPFLLLSAFVYPVTDDYCWAESFRMRGFWGSQDFFRMYWSGRYTGNLIMTANPLAFGWWGGHRIIPVLIFLAYAGSAYLFFRELTQQQLSRWTCWALSALFLFVFLAQHPFVPASFYWHSGHPYAIADIASLLLVVSFIRYETRVGTSKRVHFVLTCLLIAFIIGSNEVPLVVLILLLGALVFFSLLAQRRLRWDYVAFFVVGAIGAYFELSAAGNQARANSGLFDSYRRSDLIYTLIHVPLAAFNSLLKYFPLVLVASLLLLPLAVRLVHRATNAPALRRFLGVAPGYALLTVVGAYGIGYVPTFWAIGLAPAPLPMSIIYFWLIIGWFWLTFVLVFWWERRHPGALDIKFSQPFTTVLVMYLGLNFLGSFNFRSAYSDLLTGRAYRFDQEMKARLALVRSTPGDVITVPVLRNVPVTIVPPVPGFRDLVFSHPDDDNTCASGYFGKKAINYK
ncbi:MAG: hypothetical protein LH606_00295 [Cytophagaceae bacterium]|nr:hypothetical protein [Cytophagaceae bacterium]